MVVVEGVVVDCIRGTYWIYGAPVVALTDIEAASEQNVVGLVVFGFVRCTALMDPYPFDEVDRIRSAEPVAPLLANELSSDPVHLIEKRTTKLSRHIDGSRTK